MFEGIVGTIWSWVSGWLGIGLGSLAALGIAAWFLPFLGPVLQLAAAFLSPIISAVVQGFIWAWKTIFWPGLADILNDWVTVVTVMTMGAVLWFAVIAQNKVEIRSLNFEINQCRVELDKLHKQMPAVDKPTWELPWPWKW